MDKRILKNKKNNSNNINTNILSRKRGGMNSDATAASSSQDTMVSAKEPKAVQEARKAREAMNTQVSPPVMGTAAAVKEVKEVKKAENVDGAAGQLL